jgi:hypothetical protein
MTWGVGLEGWGFWGVWVFWGGMGVWGFGGLGIWSGGCGFGGVCGVCCVLCCMLRWLLRVLGVCDSHLIAIDWRWFFCASPGLLLAMCEERPQEQEAAGPPPPSRWTAQSPGRRPFRPPPPARPPARPPAAASRRRGRGLAGPHCTRGRPRPCRTPRCACRCPGSLGGGFGGVLFFGAVSCGFRLARGVALGGWGGLRAAPPRGRGLRPPALPTAPPPIPPRPSYSPPPHTLPPTPPLPCLMNAESPPTRVHAEANTPHPPVHMLN